MKDIIITIPKSILWADYKKELAIAASGGTINFKVRHFPRTNVGNRCYVVHKGFIKGYMIISGLSEKTFNCTTTEKKWQGKFIERTGEFYTLKEPIPMKGFQGFRYFSNRKAVNDE